MGPVNYRMITYSTANDTELAKHWKLVSRRRLGNYEKTSCAPVTASQLSDSLSQEEPSMDLGTVNLSGTEIPINMNIQSLVMDYKTISADMREDTYNINGLAEQKLIFVLSHTT